MSLLCLIVPKMLFGSTFDVVAATDPNIGGTSGYPINSRFSELFLSKLNSKSGKMGEKLLALKRHQK